MWVSYNLFHPARALAKGPNVHSGNVAQGHLGYIAVGIHAGYALVGLTCNTITGFFDLA